MSLSVSRHYLRNNDNLTLVACVCMELTGYLNTLIVTCQFLLFGYRSNWWMAKYYWEDSLIESSK